MASSEEFAPAEQCAPALESRPDVIEARDFLRERLGDGPLPPETKLGFDSMDWIELATRIGDRTGVRVDDGDLVRIETVGGLLDAISRIDGTEASAPAEPLLRPEDLLSTSQRSYLDALPRSTALAARTMFALNQAIFRRFFHLTVTGLDNLPGRRPFIIAPNHMSYWDGLVVAAALPYWRLRQLRWVAYAGVALANPITRMASRLAMMVPIDPRPCASCGLGQRGSRAQPRRHPGVVPDRATLA